MRRLLPTLLLLALVAGCSGLSGTNQGGYITGDGTTTMWSPDDRGEPVELTGDTLEGKSVDLADMRGKVAIEVQFSEQVVNLVRRHAPGAAIAFNTSGGDSVEAAERWL